MAAELLRSLLELALSSSVALLLIGALRAPLRRLVGARAAYCLWLLVPASILAALLPAPSQVLLPTVATLPGQIESMLLITTDPSAGHRVGWLDGLLIAWLGGAASLFATLLVRQYRFVRSLGELRPDTRGRYRSDRSATPMLLGLWRPRLVVPTDFETNYSSEEQELILAHEHAHAARRDVAVNALASFALCVFWFNPLCYRALAWLRMDQELACDALVLSRHASARRAYADALFRTQMAADSAWQMPIGCRWQSTHPLTERILMLKRPLPGVIRRLSGIGVTIGLALGLGYAAWAAQPAATGDGPPILVDMKITITDTSSKDVAALATRYLVHSGEEFVDANARPLDFSCTPYLPDEPGRVTDWSAIRARGIPTPAAGQILLVCAIREQGRVISSPAVTMRDGKWGTIETAGEGGQRHYRLEVSATTSTARIAEARDDASAN